MRAGVYTKAKSRKVLETKDLEQPVPKDSEVALRVRAASVNPLDWRAKTERPGVDLAGEIVAVGGKGDAVQAWRCRVRRCQRRLLRQKFKFFMANITRDDLTIFRELIKAGDVTPVIDRRYPLAETADAIAYVEQGHAKAKVVIAIK